MEAAVTLLKSLPYGARIQHRHPADVWYERLAIRYIPHGLGVSNSIAQIPLNHRVDGLV